MPHKIWKENLSSSKKRMKKINKINNPYIKVNIIFVGIIILIFIYSGIFSAEKLNYPIHSKAKKYTTEISKSEGLSRSFSEIVRFKFDSASNYNPHGIRVFSFFLIQFFLRIGISFLIFYKQTGNKSIIIIDGALSIIHYFFCFWPIIF